MNKTFFVVREYSNSYQLARQAAERFAERMRALGYRAAVTDYVLGFQVTTTEGV